MPTEAEFRAAWSQGDAHAEPHAAGAWSAATSEGRTREVGKSPPTRAGLHDLAGNVAEWLHVEPPAVAVAPVAGGSYLDAAEALRGLPLVSLEKRERARHVGFRVVVEPAVP